MKKFIKLTALAVASILTAASALAAGYYITPQSGPVQVLTSATTSTALIPASTNLVWPNAIPASSTATNVTVVSTAAGLHLALQFTGQATTTNGGNVIIQLGRSVQLPGQMPAGGVTNAVGTGLNIEWFATVTNTFPQNINGQSTNYNTFNFLFGPILGNGAGNGTGGNQGEGAITTTYIGWITTPANLVLTNYSAWAAVQ